MADAQTVRDIVLDWPETVECSHMGVVDFRAPKRTFATLPSNARLHLKLKADQKTMLVETQPETFQPVAGGWGGLGWTAADLQKLDRETLENALDIAWQNVALVRMKRAKAEKS